MKSYTITVNGTAYDVTVEEKEAFWQLQLRQQLRRQHLRQHRRQLRQQRQQLRQQAQAL